MESVEGVNQLDSENDQFLSSLEALRQRIQSQDDTLTTSLDRGSLSLDRESQSKAIQREIPLHVAYQPEYTQGLAAYSKALNAIIVGEKAAKSSEEALVAALRHEKVHALFCNLSADEQATIVDGLLRRSSSIITVALALDYFGYTHEELNSPLVDPEFRGKKIKRPITYTTANGEAKTADAADIVNELLAYAFMGDIKHAFSTANSERRMIVEAFFKFVRSYVKNADPDVQKLLEEKGFYSLEVTELLQELKNDVAYSENSKNQIKINTLTQYRQQTRKK